MSLPMMVFPEALIPDPGFPAEPDLVFPLRNLMN